MKKKAGKTALKNNNDALSLSTWWIVKVCYMLYTTISIIRDLARDHAWKPLYFYSSLQEENTVNLCRGTA